MKTEGLLSILFSWFSISIANAQICMIPTRYLEGEGTEIKEPRELLLLLGLHGKKLLFAVSPCPLHGFFFGVMFVCYWFLSHISIFFTLALGCILCCVLFGSLYILGHASSSRRTRGVFSPIFLSCFSPFLFFFISPFFLHLKHAWKASRTAIYRTIHNPYRTQH